PPISIRSIMIKRHKTKFLAKSPANHLTHALYFLHQLQIDDTHIMSWKFLKYTLDKPAQGRISNWYNSILHGCSSDPTSRILLPEYRRHIPPSAIWTRLTDITRNRLVRPFVLYQDVLLH